MALNLEKMLIRKKKLVLIFNFWKREELLLERLLKSMFVKKWRKVLLMKILWILILKNYIEIRIADSVPIKKALGYVALLKGIVYSEQNLEILDKELQEVATAKQVQEAIELIEKDGLESVIYNKLTAEQWANHFVELAKKALPDNEQEYLNYV